MGRASFCLSSQGCAPGKPNPRTQPGTRRAVNSQPHSARSSPHVPFFLHPLWNALPSPASSEGAWRADPPLSLRSPMHLVIPLRACSCSQFCKPSTTNKKLPTVAFGSPTRKLVCCFIHEYKPCNYTAAFVHNHQLWMGRLGNLVRSSSILEYISWGMSLHKAQLASPCGKCLQNK